MAASHHPTRANSDKVEELPSRQKTKFDTLAMPEKWSWVCFFKHLLLDWRRWGHRDRRILARGDTLCLIGSIAPAPGIHIPQESGMFGLRPHHSPWHPYAQRVWMFGWRLHPSLWHPYIQRVWNVRVEVPSQAPSPGSCLSPDSTPRKPAKQWTLPREGQDHSHRVFKQQPRAYRMEEKICQPHIKE